MLTTGGVRTVLVAALIVASCGGSVSPTDRPASPSQTASVAPSAVPTPAATTPTPVVGEAPSPQNELADALDARLGPNGEVDKQLALDMFAAAYGHGEELGATPLPGAVEATTGLMLVLQAWDQLTPAQQDVVNGVLRLPSQIGLTHGDSAQSRGVGAAALAVSVATDPAADLVYQQFHTVASLWGSNLSRGYRVELMDADITPVDSDHSSPLADELPVQNDGVTPAFTMDQYALCRIRIFPAFRSASAVDQLATAAHEVFHCFQNTVISLNDSVLLRSGQLWVIEGQAEWVGAKIAGGGATAEGWWEPWLTRSQKLWRRDYDAIGFYASLARHGVDPWTVFRPMLSLGAAPFPQMYAAATPGLTTDFLAQVAVDHASVESIGDPWLPAGPGAQPVSVDVINMPSSAVANLTRNVAAYDFERVAASLTDEVVSLQSDVGPWAYGSAGEAVIVSAPGVQYGCVHGDCICPDGLALSIPQIGTNGLVAVGLTAAETGVSPLAIHLKIISMPLATACTVLPHLPGTAMGCIAGQWTLASQTFGDQFIPGLEGIQYEGGVGGRHLDIAPNGEYVMTDDGSDPVTGHGETGGFSVDVVVTLTGRVEGKVDSASAATANFASTSASIDLHVEENVGGAPIQFDHHYDDAGYFGNGAATVTCDEDSMTLDFLKIVQTYTRG